MKRHVVCSPGDTSLHRERPAPHRHKNFQIHRCLSTFSAPEFVHHHRRISFLDLGLRLFLGNQLASNFRADEGTVCDCGDDARHCSVHLAKANSLINEVRPVVLDRFPPFQHLVVDVGAGVSAQSHVGDVLERVTVAQQRDDVEPKERVTLEPIRGKTKDVGKPQEAIGKLATME